MTQDRARRPAGAPTGGQFAPGTRDETQAALPPEPELPVLDPAILDPATTDGRLLGLMRQSLARDPQALDDFHTAVEGGSFHDGESGVTLSELALGSLDPRTNRSCDPVVIARRARDDLARWPADERALDTHDLAYAVGVAVADMEVATRGGPPPGQQVRISDDSALSILESYEETGGPDHAAVREWLKRRRAGLEPLS